MVKKHGQKQRAKARSRRTGAAYASAAAGARHEHTPLPDMAVLEDLPHHSGRELDTELAARLVAACHAQCRPCQKTLARKLRTEQRPTLVALAAAIYGALPTPGFIASATTREWAPLARAGKTDPAAAAAALAAVEEMDDADASDLLEDTLDHWAMVNADPARITETVKVVHDAPPRQRPTDPMDAFREAGVKVFTLDDLDLGDDVDLYHLQPNYGVYVGATNTPDGQDFPMLTLYPETEDAGIEDLERRTDWEHWGLHGMPDMDPRWRLRARIADRSLQGLVHVDADGRDDIELWRASETVSMPDAWWDLLDRAQHVLVVGPSEPAALQDTADEGKLLAVVGRVSFV
ncbi:hypothetical protein HHL19_35655 [Streptomyces sp. R302]|uniref:hypothetical protein n=1 Tax=unclassified Streptomyces TaxID=2593676 RepID=UPI00145EDA5B|nr:hypothetical protein [Streptomyces sp. R301]NML83846.1 hypothetical protein [Streptomyces sp. R302]